MIITAECTNPDMMQVKVTIEMTLGQWRNVKTILEGSNPYYSPIEEIHRAIQTAIINIEQREIIHPTRAE